MLQPYENAQTQCQVCAGVNENKPKDLGHITILVAHGAITPIAKYV